MIEKFVVIPDGCDCKDTDAFDSPDKYIFNTLEVAKAFAKGAIFRDRDAKLPLYNIYKITAKRL